MVPSDAAKINSNRLIISECVPYVEISCPQEFFSDIYRNMITLPNWGHVLGGLESF